MHTEVKQIELATSALAKQFTDYKVQSVPVGYSYWNRAVNIFFGLCGALILLLFLPVLALLIFIDSPGPIFYNQERLGYQGRLFRIYKFRTMQRDTDCTAHTLWAQVADPRVTHVGRCLRSTHLDELPQTWNILCGDMSMIGPRPELPIFSAKLEKAIPDYTCRVAVKPGLTGLAQVRHHYGDTTEDERIKLGYDLHYIQHRSIALDFKIICETVSEVVCGRGR